MIDLLLNQIVLRRDGNVAKVTGISDGWLLLDGSVDDSALPNEVLVIDFSLSDDEIIKLAYEFGIDPLQAKRVPDLARKRFAQDNYAFQVLQKIDHPNIKNAYITILGVNEADRYKIRVKPEKGASYDMVLGEIEVRKFEQEGVLPVTSKLEFNIGDIVRLGEGDRVVILEEKTDKEWQILNPVSGDGESIPLDTVMFPTSKSVADVINDLMDERENEVIRQKDLLKQIDGLRAEAGALNRQLEKVQESQQDLEREKAVKQLELEKQAHEMTKSKLNEALEDGATVRLQLRQMQNNPVPVASMNGNQKPVECKIIMKTGESEFERHWAEGWTCEHMQFTHDGHLRTVWQKVNRPEPSDNGNGIHSAQVVADINEVADVIYDPNPIEINIPERVEQPANRVSLGKYGTALMLHGLPKTTEAMDAEVTLAGLRASQTGNSFDNRKITQFLPSSSAVQS